MQLFDGWQPDYDDPRRFTYLVQTHSQVPFTQHPPINRNAEEVPT